jgi:hypothetical protein
MDFACYADSAAYCIPDYYGDTVYTAARYSIVMPEHLGDENLSELHDSITSIMFGVTGKSFSEAAAAFKQRGPQELNDVDSTFTHQPAKYPEAINAEKVNIFMSNSHVALLTPTMLVMCVANYEYYSGAAHGMQSKTYLNYSLGKHQLLTAANTFRSGSESKLLEIINRAAHEKYNDDGELFSEPIAAFENFFLTPEEVIFVYQPYEVGPFSTGIVEVPVSQYELYDLLTPTAKQALELAEE